MSTKDLNTIKDDEAARIVLIDSNALIHRSYHAIPHLTTHDGKLVNAVYGFAATILRVLEDLKPRYIVATFDVSKDTFRRKMYAEYKAQRVAAPQELYDQIPLVKQVCEVLNIPIFAVEGYEADDVIGTIVHKLKTQNEKLKTTTKNSKLIDNNLLLVTGYLSHSFIVTGDKDTYQLVDDNTFVYSIIKGLKNVEIIDRDYVQDKYGFGPEHMVDYKALRGDPSDNIPGVPGIGEVTAKKLIQNFQSIENLYQQILNSKSEILNKSKIQISNDQKPNQLLKPKTIDLLIDNKAQAFLSKDLSTIKTDVPLDFDIGCCLVHDYDKEKALKLFNKLEFKSLISRLPDQHSRHEQVKLF